MKERELLQRVITGDDDGDFFLSHGLYKEIQDLLAQPDINTQYLLDQVARLTVENAMLKEKWSTPKREPLSDEEITKAYSTRAEQVAFEEGIIFAKILYGIGGE